MGLKEQLTYIKEKLGLRYLEFETSKLWAADKSLAQKSPNQYQINRLEIRKALSQNLRRHGSVTSDEQIRLNDLSTFPIIKGYSISIAHCPKRGGFAFTHFPWQVGMDLEVPERVTAQIIERVSRPEERAALTDPAALWTAKEAGFKTFSKIGGLSQLIQDLTIHRSTDLPDLAMTEFEAHCHQIKGVGFSFLNEACRVSMFFVKVRD
jgi:hypothetical protein